MIMGLWFDITAYCHCKIQDLVCEISRDRANLTRNIDRVE